MSELQVVYIEGDGQQMAYNKHDLVTTIYMSKRVK